MTRDKECQLLFNVADLKEFPTPGGFGVAMLVEEGYLIASFQVNEPVKRLDENQRAALFTGANKDEPVGFVTYRSTGTMIDVRVYDSENNLGISLSAIARKQYY